MTLAQSDKPSAITLEQSIDHRFLFLSRLFKKIGPHQAVESDSMTVNANYAMA